MARRKNENKKTTTKNDDKIIEDIIDKSTKEAMVETELLPEPEPEEVLVVVEDEVITSKKAPKSIEVRYFGYRGKGLIHGGRANEPEYQFTGKGSVTITNPIDIAFFQMKAEKNPTKWKVI